MQPTSTPEQLLQRILRSGAFSGSPHADLLDYICFETQRNNFEALREHDIGVTVFGLEPGYDVGQNGIVGTLAEETRLKLAEFFRTEGRRESLRMAIPKGEFRAFFYEADPSQIAAPAPTALELFWQEYWRDDGRNLLLHGAVSADSMPIPEAYAAVQIALLFEQRSASIELRPAAAFLDGPLPAADFVLIGTPQTNPLINRLLPEPPVTAILQRISPADGRGAITILAAPEPAAILHASSFATTEELMSRLLEGLGGLESFPPDFRLTLSSLEGESRSLPK